MLNRFYCAVVSTGSEMKKTKFERFMLKATRAAMDQEGLDTFAEHLDYARLLIELELCKKGAKKPDQPEKILEKKGETLKLIKNGLIGSWSLLKRIFTFLKTGNNLAYAIMGAIFAYAALVMLGGMF